MSWLTDLVSNPFLMTSISAWLVAQVLKVIIHAIITKKLDLSRMFGDGGMPSAHSAVVSSLTIFCGLYYGLDSVYFAITVVLALIVFNDAMGVRRETGKQAVILNEMARAFEELSKEDLPEVKLKEFVGHSPIQVFAGIIIGVTDAVIMYFLIV